MKDKMLLDEVEACIQLVQLEYPELRGAPYEKIKAVIEEEFLEKVAIEDIYLLHEPTISEDEEATAMYYGRMFNMGYSEYY